MYRLPLRALFSSFSTPKNEFHRLFHRSSISPASDTKRANLVHICAVMYQYRRLMSHKSPSSAPSGTSPKHSSSKIGSKSKHSPTRSNKVHPDPPSPLLVKNKESIRHVELVECPRDAMQGLRDFVPTEKKIQYINALLQVGFDTVDFGSFVSAPAVPQMRDTPEVLAGLDLTNSSSKLLAVVGNVKGAMIACKYDKITYVGYPLSASETFQMKNTNRSVATALEDLELISTLCQKHDKRLVTYINMAFGNPFGEPHSVARVDELIDKVIKLGCATVAVADTIGVSDAQSISETFGRILPKYEGKTVKKGSSSGEERVRIAAHFHSGTTTCVEKVTAALNSGVRRLESAIGGMGGCPFAKSTLVGNLPTEAIVEILEENKIRHGLNLEKLKECEEIKHRIFGVGVKELLLATVLGNEKEFVKLALSHFSRYDNKRQGYLLKPEFQQAMQDVFIDLGELPPTQAKVDRAFASLDVLGNGLITFDEYMLGARRLLNKRLKEKEIIVTNVASKKN